MKKITIQSVFKDSGIYIGSTAVTQLFFLFSFLIITRVLSVADIGCVELFLSVVPLLIMFGSTGIDTAVSYYYNASSDHGERTKIISTALCYRLLTSAIIVVFLAASRGALFSFLNISNRYEVAFYWFLALFVLKSNFMFLSNIFRLTFAKLKFFILYGINECLAFACLCALFLMGRQFSIVMYAQIVCFSAFCAIGYAVISTRKEIAAGFDFTLLKKLLAYGSPAIFGGIAMYFMNFTDRIIIAKYLQMEYLGIYAVGFKVASVMLLVVSGFSTAWVPSMLRAALAENNTSLIGKTLEAYLYATLMLFLGLTCFSKEIVSIIAPQKYILSVSVVSFLVAAKVLYGFYNIVHSGIVLAKKLIFHSLIIFLSGALNICLSIIAVRQYGVVGVAGATFISWLFAALVALIISQRLHYVAYNKMKLVLHILFIIIFVPYAFGVAMLTLGERALCFIVGAVILTLINYEKILYFLRLHRQKML